jgi:hypothetical protein
MAFYICIEKLIETPSEAVFRFYDTAYPNEVGELQLNKENGTVKMIKATREVFYVRAAHKVKVAYKTGAVPNFLEWVS